MIYILIKEYPFSPPVGIKLTYNAKTNYFEGIVNDHKYAMDQGSLDRYSEFWQKQINLYSVTFEGVCVNNIEFFRKLNRVLKNYLNKLKNNDLNSDDIFVLESILRDMDNLEDLTK